MERKMRRDGWIGDGKKSREEEIENKKQQIKTVHVPLFLNYIMEFLVIVLAQNSRILLKLIII